MAYFISNVDALNTLRMISPAPFTVKFAIEETS